MISNAVCNSTGLIGNIACQQGESCMRGCELDSHRDGLGSGIDPGSEACSAHELHNPALCLFFIHAELLGNHGNINASVQLAVELVHLAPSRFQELRGEVRARFAVI